MSQIDAPAPPARATPEPLPPEITSTQPGGGVCYRIELAWGRWRRWVLKTFNRGYVARMRALRCGRMRSRGSRISRRAAVDRRAQGPHSART